MPVIDPSMATSNSRGQLTQGPAPSFENLLMAAADMHSRGQLTQPAAEPAPTTPKGQQVPKLPTHSLKRKLKVVK